MKILGSKICSSWLFISILCSYISTFDKISDFIDQQQNHN